MSTYRRTLVQYLLKLLVFMDVEKLEFATDTCREVLLERATGRNASAHRSSAWPTATHQCELDIILEIRSGFVVGHAERTLIAEISIRACRTGATTGILTNGNLIPADVHGQGRSTVGCYIPTRHPWLFPTSA